MNKTFAAVMGFALVFVMLATVTVVPMAYAEETEEPETDGTRCRVWNIRSTSGFAWVFGSGSPQKVDASLHLVIKLKFSSGERELTVIAGQITIGDHKWKVVEGKFVSGSQYASSVNLAEGESTEIEQRVIDIISQRKRVLKLKLEDNDGNTAYMAMGGHRNEDGTLTLRAAGFSLDLWRMAIAKFRAVVS